MSGSRQPAARLPTGNRPLTSQDVSGQLRNQRANPLSDTVLIEGLETDATTSTNYFKHGLGRAFRGAYIVGQDQQTIALATVSPKEAKRQGKDPAVFFGVRASATTVVTFNAVVF